MIRHWVEAMGDHNPVYVDEAAARDAGFPGIIAPPTMLQAWIMRGLRASQEADRARANGEVSADSPSDELMALLDEAGFTSVVATNCDQHYVRPLVLGDHLEVTSVIDSVSAEKATGLGVGHFVTTRLEFTDQHGEPVATMRFRILKFKPRPEGAESRPHPGGDRPPEAAPSGAHPGQQLLLRGGEAAQAAHPALHRTAAPSAIRPARRVPTAGRSTGTRSTASGRGTIYSFVVNHYPQVPAFDYPLVVALVELEEGTRLVANVSGIAPEEMAIGMPVVAEFVEFDDDLTLPVFRPASDGPGDQRDEEELMDFTFDEEQRAVQEPPRACSPG